MCESNAYFLNRDGTEELVMESVNYVKPYHDKVLLRSIFGEEKMVEAVIRELNLTAHTILLQHGNP